VQGARRRQILRWALVNARRACPGKKETEQPQYPGMKSTRWRAEAALAVLFVAVISLLTFPDLGLAIAAAANVADAGGVDPFALQVAEAFTRQQHR
jgi:hypothetical protein